MTLKKAALSLAAIAVAAYGSAQLAGCGRSATKEQASAPPAAEVTVAEVVNRPLHEWDEFTGRLEAVQSVEIRPRVSGFIDQVSFEEGSRVKKGQLLFRIDPRPFQAEVDRLVAQRERAQSQLGLTKSDHDRAKRLIDENAISREEFDRLSTADTSASSDLSAANAALAAAKLNLEFTQVRAPIDGRVSRAMITAGNLVSSNDVLTTLVSDDPVYAYFDADEQTYLRYSHPNPAGAQPNSQANTNPVFMGLANEEGFQHQGRMNFVDNRLDPKTGTIRGRAVFANADGSLTPGLFARIRLVGNRSEDTVLIDDKAIGTDLGHKFVLVLKSDNTVDYRAIETGPLVDGLRVVKSGLAAGDVIVVNGLQHVRPGSAVTPTKVAMNGGRGGLEQVAADHANVTVAEGAGHEAGDMPANVRTLVTNR